MSSRSPHRSPQPNVMLLLMNSEMWVVMRVAGTATTTTSLMKTRTCLSFKKMKSVSPKVMAPICNPWCHLPCVSIKTSLNSEVDNDQALINSILRLH